MTERVIIDIYQYTMLCLTANATTIAAFAIQLATHMLGFGTKIREFWMMTSARELYEAKLVFCEAIDDSYRSEMVRSSPNVRNFLIEWYDSRRSELQTILEAHCSQYEHEQHLPWRQHVNRSQLDLPDQPAVRMAEVVPATEAAAVQSVVAAARFADEQSSSAAVVAAVANGHINGIDGRHDNIHGVLADVADLDSANNKCDGENGHVEVNDDDDDVDHVGINGGGVVLPDDDVVSSPVPIVVGGDPARTSPPESSPEEGELPLTHSLEALRRSARTKRSRALESK